MRKISDRESFEEAEKDHRDALTGSIILVILVIIASIVFTPKLFIGDLSENIATIQVLFIGWGTCIYYIVVLFRESKYLDQREEELNAREARKKDVR